MVGEQVCCSDLAFGPVEVLVSTIGLDLDVAVGLEGLWRLEGEDVVSHGDVVIGIPDDIRMEIAWQTIVLVGKDKLLACFAYYYGGGLS